VRIIHIERNDILLLFTVYARVRYARFARTRAFKAVVGNDQEQFWGEKIMTNAEEVQIMRSD